MFCRIASVFVLLLTCCLPCQATPPSGKRVDIALHWPGGWQERYEKHERDMSSLKKKERWYVRVHGLRGAMLHPKLWGMRRLDRTDNRSLVPIRPYFLRASTKDDFRLENIALKLKFKRAAQWQMKQSREIFDPVIEIRFAAEYVDGMKGEEPVVDRGYLLRLSALPDLSSGFFFRSRNKWVKLADLTTPVFPTNRPIDAELRVSENQAEAFINGELAASINGQALDRGLISLISSWHPVILEQLEVTGAATSGDKEMPYKESGLLFLK